MLSFKVCIEDLEESNKKNKKWERKNETCRKRTVMRSYRRKRKRREKYTVRIMKDKIGTREGRK